MLEINQTTFCSKKTIVRVVKDKNNPYVQINKTCLNDINISWKAKGLLAYILSMPDDWVFYIEELETHASDGVFATRTAIEELRTHGYVERYPVREKGRIVRWEFLVHEFPIVIQASSEVGPPPHSSTVDFSTYRKPTYRKPTYRKPQTTKNDSTNNDITNNHNDLNDLKKEKESSITTSLKNKQSLKSREAALSADEFYAYQKLLKVEGIYKGAAIIMIEKSTVGEIEYVLECSLLSHIRNRAQYILGCFFKEDNNEHKRS